MENSVADWPSLGCSWAALLEDGTASARSSSDEPTGDYAACTYWQFTDLFSKEQNGTTYPEESRPRIKRNQWTGVNGERGRG